MEDHVRHHNDMLAHVGQDEVELVQKTVRSVMGDLASYYFNRVYMSVILRKTMQLTQM